MQAIKIPHVNKILQLFAMLFIIACSSTQISWAADLDSAKTQGLIGEQPNGYLALVVDNAPNDVKALVDDVNQKRREKYQQIASSRNIDLSQVETIAGKKAIEKTAPGNYIQLNGNWIKK